MAFEVPCDLFVCLRQTSASLLGSTKFWSDAPFRRANQRGTNDQNQRNRHARLDGRFPDFTDERSHALSRGPRIIVRMRKLKIVCSEHQNDKRQRRIDLNALRKPLQPVSARLKGIIKNCPPAIQAIFNDSHPQSGSVQPVFKNPGPSLIKSKSISTVGNNSPSQRVAVDEDLVHTVFRRAFYRATRFSAIAQ